MIISWNTTRRCNLFCKHCYRDAGPKEKAENELTTIEGYRLLEQIKLAGFKILILSGGEPLLRSDIYELVSKAQSIGLYPVLGTNGIMLTQVKAERLKASGLAGVGISLDSIDSKQHDLFRNQDGAWKAAVEGINNAITAGIKVQVNMTLTLANCEQFTQMADFVAGLGVKAFHPFFLVPTGRGKDIEIDGLKKEKYFQMLRTVLEKQSDVAIELKPTCAPQFMPLARDMGIKMRFSRGCLAGVSYCCILPDGEVHICPYLPVKAGNVKETPFHKLWQESKVFAQLRDFSKYQGRCGKCPDVDICGGCRARAYYYGDANYLAEEPWCYKEL